MWMCDSCNLVFHEKCIAKNHPKPTVDDDWHCEQCVKYGIVTGGDTGAAGSASSSKKRAQSSIKKQNRRRNDRGANYGVHADDGANDDDTAVASSRTKCAQSNSKNQVRSRGSGAAGSASSQANKKARVDGQGYDGSTVLDGNVLHIRLNNDEGARILDASGSIFIMAANKV